MSFVDGGGHIHHQWMNTKITLEAPDLIEA
jgi:hypothetical protein